MRHGREEEEEGAGAGEEEPLSKRRPTTFLLKRRDGTGRETEELNEDRDEGFLWICLCVSICVPLNLASQ